MIWNNLGPVDIQSLVFTSAFVTTSYNKLLQHQTAPAAMVASIFSDPVNYIDQSQLPSPILFCQDSVPQPITAKVFNTSRVSAIEWLCIDDVIGSFSDWVHQSSTNPLWNVHHIFTSNDHTPLFRFQLVAVLA
jgi:hypothetical protein